MIRIIEESTKYYIVREDSVIIDDGEAKSREDVENNKWVQMTKRSFRNNFDEDIYILTWDEYKDKFGEYPRDFYVVKDRFAKYSFNVKDKATAEREARREFDSDEYDEVLSYDEYLEKYDRNPDLDIDGYDYSDYEEIDDGGNPYDEYGNRIDGRHDDYDDDYGPSNPWDAPGMKPDDFI